MEYLHFFETNSEFDTQYNGVNYIEPWVSYTEDKNRVDYNKMTREMLIFQYIYCNNVTEEDRYFLKNASMIVSVWTGNTPSVSIQFYSGDFFIIQHVSISQELCSQLEAINQQGSYDERQGKLLDAALPLFKCQGEAEHTWRVMPSPS